VKKKQQRLLHQLNNVPQVTAHNVPQVTAHNVPQVTAHNVPQVTAHSALQVIVRSVQQVARAAVVADVFNDAANSANSVQIKA
jgi:hypothetical protein